MTQPLLINHIEMWKLIDKEKNAAEMIDTSNLTLGSGKSINFICSCNHRYKKRICDVWVSVQKGKESCPYCDNKLTLYEDSLINLHSERVMKYWDFITNSNNGLFPCKLSPSSNKTAHIYCKIHDFRGVQKISDLQNHIPCGYCSGKLILSDESLKTLFPEISELVASKEYEKKYKKEYNPEKIHPNSHIKLPFNCEYCNEIHWQEPASRIRQIYGCEKYNSMYHTSIPQEVLYLAIKKILPDAVSKIQISSLNLNNQVKSNHEFDIYSPSKRLAIEYDGGLHNNAKSVLSDEWKNKYCKEQNILMIRIREDLASTINMYGFTKIDCSYSNNFKYLYEVISKLFHILKFHYKDLIEIIDTQEINLDELISDAINNLSYLRRKNSFGIKYPGLLKIISEDDLVKAFALSSKSSSIKLNCICINCNHKFTRSAKNLVSTKGNCPKCLHEIINIQDSNSSIQKSLFKARPENSLQVLYPKLAKFYSNDNLLESNRISSKSNYKVKFKCPYCKNEFEQILKNFVNSGGKCKYCFKLMSEYDF